MEELNDNSCSLIWGAIANITEKIGAVEETIPGYWDDLCNMVADVVEKSGEMEKPEEVLSVFSFLKRVYYRLRSKPVKRDFNIITKTENVTGEYYRITNYDYKTYCWVRQLGIIDYITNDYIDLPVNKLEKNVCRNLDRRIRKD